jgi:hypothetical protein
MNDKTAQQIGTAISIVQLLQMGLSLINAAKQAAENGQTEVTDEQLHASLDENDAALADQVVAIARAKAEGR